MEAHLQQQSGMATAAGGKVQNAAAGTGERCEAPNPKGREILIVR
jgi:hypothetical protein